MASKLRSSRYAPFPLERRIMYGDRPQTDSGTALRLDVVQPERPTSWAAIVGSTPYITKQDDNFLDLATSTYGDPRKWSVIADFNPEVFYPLDLVEQTTLVLPPPDVISEVSSLL